VNSGFIQWRLAHSGRNEHRPGVGVGVKPGAAELFEHLRQLSRAAEKAASRRNKPLDRGEEPMDNPMVLRV
jgi:hypothetical protein